MYGYPKYANPFNSCPLLAIRHAPYALCLAPHALRLELSASSFEPFRLTPYALRLAPFFCLRLNINPFSFQLRASRFQRTAVSGYYLNIEKLFEIAYNCTKFYR